MATRRWRFPRFRIKLLTVLILVTISAVFIAGPVRRVHHQKKAAKAVLACGGTVIYDWENRKSRFEKRTGSMPGPKWLRKLIGDDYFQKIVTIEPTYAGIVGSKEDPRAKTRPVLSLAYPMPMWRYDKPETFENMLRSISKVKSLVKVDLGNSTLKDSQLVHLRRMKRVEHLILSSTDITGEGLIYLKRMKRLKRLDLSYTSVGDSCMVHLTKLKALQEVDLSGTEIHGRRLNHLQSLPNLKDLQLSYTILDPTFVTHVQKLPKLQNMSMRSCLISSYASYAAIYGPDISAFDQQMFDTSVKSLANMRALKSLELQDTCATKEAIKWFQRARPKVDLSTFKGVEPVMIPVTKSRPESKNDIPPAPSAPQAKAPANPFG